MAQQIQYDSKQKQLIHQLIEAVFSGQALNQFCATHYPTVFERFSPDLTTPSKIQLLIEHCARHKQLGALVSKIRQAQPEAYQAFVQQVEASTRKSPPPTNEAPPSPPPDQAKPVDMWLNRVLADRYRLDELLDQSGLSAVFKASDLKLDLEVALKIIDLEQLRQTTTPDSVQQQARTAMKLDHPGLVQVYDFGQVASKFYLVEELVPGSTLQEVRQTIEAIDRQRVLPQALHLMHQLCLTVDYLHQQGLRQPSLAPDNIMFKPSSGAENFAWQPVLTNFALLRLAGDRLLTGLEIPPDRLTYQVSPELLLGRVTDIRSDIYALGILFYYLLVGQPPFQPVNLTQATRLHAETAPPSPGTIVPDLPEQVEQVVLKALAKNPADRYPTAKAMAQAVAECLEALTVPAAIPRTDVAILGPDQPLTATPGQAVHTRFTLRNEGKREHYCQIKVDGIPTNWLSIAPSAVTLAPGEMRDVAITIEPPHTSASRAGRHSLVIQVLSQEELGQRSEITRILTITPYSQFTSSLWPQEISAGQTVQVAVENQGNYPETFTIIPKPDQSLVFEPDRIQLQVSPGDQATADFQVSPRQRIWVGRSARHTLSFQVDSPQGAAEVVSGELTSQGLVTPEWALGGLLVLILCACAAIVTYFSIDNWINVAPTAVAPTMGLTTPIPPLETPTETPIPEPPTAAPTLEPPPLTTEPPIETPIATPLPTVIPTPGQPPVGVIVAPQDGEVGQSITFDAGNSRASDQIVSYAWQLGDGATANAVIINHTYRSAGTYNVILTVTDAGGLTDTTTHLIQIREAAPPDTPEPEQPPTAVITEPEQVVAGQPATFDGSGSQPGGSPIVRYTWDFGDLSPQAGGITVQHTYEAPGSYLVTLQVADENGVTNTARVRLRVSQAEEAPQ